MIKHESKKCPRCQKEFECKVGNITECQCYEVQMDEKEHYELEKLGYTDCLCADCLQIFKNLENKSAFSIKNI